VGLENWQYPHSLMGLSKTLLLGGDVEGAAEAGREALRIFRGGRFADHPYTGYAMTNLASILAETGEIEDAESSAREALDFLGRRLEEGHWRLAVADGILGDCSSRRGDYEDAEPRLLRAYEAVNRVLSPRSSSTRAALQRLVELYDAWGKPDKADEYRTLLGTAT
jgi:tetratricopeptide (TPR) repeat protein